MSLSHSILGFLSYGSMTGYDLAKAFSSSVKFFWHAQASHIYLELGKLEQRALVTCEHVMQTEKPNKKLYSITDDGRREFLHWLCSESDGFSKGGKDAFLMRVFFSGASSPEQSIMLLNRFIEDSKRYLAELQGVPESVEGYGRLVEPHHTQYWQFTADYGCSFMQMRIDWAERCIKQLEAMV